jgi:hypothetical protein
VDGNAGRGGSELSAAYGPNCELIGKLHFTSFARLQRQCKEPLRLPPQFLLCHRHHPTAFYDAAAPWAMLLSDITLRLSDTTG